MDQKSLIYLTETMSYKIKTLDNLTLEFGSRYLAPKLLDGVQKGLGGVIGIVGGSEDFSGAPYFTGIAALRTGADSVHLFCHVRETAYALKSFCPDLIVHPVLKEDHTLGKITQWLPQINVLIIGPGLTDTYFTRQLIKDLVKTCRVMEKPIIIDGKALIKIVDKPEIIKDYPGVILTPNAQEYKSLFDNKEPNQKILDTFGYKCVVLKKGTVDEIYSADSKGFGPTGGSARRCDGQGDFLTGVLATFYNWALHQSYDITRVFSACYAASKLTKECNARAYNELGRGMITSDMIDKIGKVFKENFEGSSVICEGLSELQSQQH